MNRMKRKWTSLTIAFTILATLITPTVASAAGPRIDITSPIAATNITTGMPADLNTVPRFTTTPITITASIQNITDDQVAGIYYEITNIKSNPNNNVVSVVKSNPAVHLPGAFTITFNNVELTDGLNKIIIKMGDTSVVASAPSWAYFTPTTNISNLTANGVPFLDTKSYPTNPATTSSVTIAGQASNATSVEVTVGNTAPKTVFLNNGVFFFTVDNKATSTATFHVNSGDNPLMIVAKNSTKSYQLKKNLIYDDGNPYALNATISTTYNNAIPNGFISNTENISINATTLRSTNLNFSEVAPGTVEVWSGLARAGTKYTNFTVQKDIANPGKSYLQFTGSPPATAYVYYSYGLASLLNTPTTTTTNVEVSASLKDDLNSIGGLKYRFVDVIAGGSRFGPYDLGGATPATVAFNNAMTPTSINEGYSTDALIGIQGTGLNNSGTALTATISDVLGANVMGATTNTIAPVFINSTGTMAFFKPSSTGQTLTNAGSPYTVAISDGTKTLNTYQLTVSNIGTIAKVKTGSAVITGVKAGYTGLTKTLTLLTATAPNGTAFSANASALSVTITDLTGQNSLVPTANGTITAVNGSDTDFTYNLPDNLPAGDYLIKVNYNSQEMMSTYFTVAPADPASATVVNNPPATQQVISNNSVLNATYSTYITVTGTNFGIDLADITTARLHVNGVAVGTTAGDVALTPYFVNGTSAIFNLPNPFSLTAGTVYDVIFNDQIRYANGNAFGAVQTLQALAVVKSVAITSPSYNGEGVSAISPLQVLQATTTPIKLNLTGSKLLDNTTAAGIQVEILNVDGVSLAGTASVTSIDTIGGLSAVATLSPLTVGTYLVRVKYNGNILTVYPLTIAGPSLSSISPNLMATNNWSPTSKLTIFGTGFGLDPTKLTLKLVNDATPTQIFTLNVAPSSLKGGTQAQFVLPNLQQGMYSAYIQYNSVVIGSPLKYTVAPPQPVLNENAALSVANQYKVFDFSADLTIPTTRDQVVQYRFYNLTTDTLPPTTFSYHYVDPNLPYLDHTLVGLSQQLDELNPNTIGEMPNYLSVYANLKTAKVNLYTGAYTSSSIPYGLPITTFTLDPSGTYRIFKIPLTTLPNGATQFTIIPSNLTTTTPAQQGENLTGRKTYDINIASTPYIIINNLYTGMVVKDPLSEIICTTSTGVPISGCISGKLVNVPLTGWSATSPTAKVEMYINNSKSILNCPTCTPSDFDPLSSTFHVQFDVAHGGPLKEGKNTISFYIYVGGVLATQTSYDVFVFTTTAPEFQNVKPIESSDVIKFTPGTRADTYSTSETAVSFNGQFINATDLKLTVKQTDPTTGKQVSIYDRRISGVSQPDPVNNNPGYLSYVNFTQTPLSFLTNSINLAIKGDTIFEFSITNSSNVTITKAITITREPLSYVVVYPALTKNSKGVDQANINSNFVEIEMAAENADSVNFGGKLDAVKRQVTDQYGNLQTHYFYEVSGLKAGANTVKFTVARGTKKTSGTFTLFNANTTIEGAQYKTVLTPSVKVFNGDIDLKFPAGTNLMRNDPEALNQYLTTDRKILFGIASNVDGRVDKFKNPSSTDGQVNNPNPLIPPSGKLLLTEPTGRFRPAGKLYWIDAGTIPSNETDKTKALNGSGRLPYDTENFFSRNINDLVVPTKRGTLTLKYDSNIRSDSWKYITVYHYEIYEDYTGSKQFRWHNIGGVVDPTKNTITVPFETFGYYQVMFMGQSFDDVTSHSWARNQLDTLYSKGIMVNKSDNAFIPNDNINRGEFTALLVKIFDIPLQYSETPTFADVLRVNPLTKGMYDYRYIETAAKVGIVRGGGGGRFSPEESITRQDAATMIARAANLKLNSDVDKSLINLQKSFTDANSIDLYARFAVEAVSKAGLVEGKQNVLIQGQKKATFRFDPTQTFTRAEAAEVAIRVLRQQKKIPK